MLIMSLYSIVFFVELFSLVQLYIFSQLKPSLCSNFGIFVRKNTKSGDKSRFSNIHQTMTVSLNDAFSEKILRIRISLH